MVIRIILIYFIFFNLCSSFFPISLLPLTATLKGQTLILSTLLLIFISFKQILNKKYAFYLFLYIIVIFVSVLFIQQNKLGTVFLWSSPVVIYYTIEPAEYKYYKPLFFFLVGLFLANAGVGICEKIFGERFLSVNEDNEVLMDQIRMSERLGSNAFRSFGLMGHPLTNANIMSFMSFMFYFNKSFFSRRLRILILLLGFVSLFCFNARAAILITMILLIPIFIKIIRKEAANKFWALVVLLIGITVFIGNFSSFGGRLNEGLLDDSSQVRFLALEYFFSLHFEDLLLGGNQTIAGENGLLMTLESFGLFLGGIKICLEFFFAYNFLGNIDKMGKWMIFISLVFIGSSNNNLYYPLVFPFYMLCISFIMNHSNANT